MKKYYSCLFLSLALLLASPIGFGFYGCKTPPSRQTYDTISSVAKSVDLAEREYLDRVISGQVGTNDFTRIQAGYAAFQESLRAAIAVSMNDTNALAPASLSAAASRLVLDIQTAKGGK